MLTYEEHRELAHEAYMLKGQIADRELWINVARRDASIFANLAAHAAQDAKAATSTSEKSMYLRRASDARHDEQAIRGEIQRSLADLKRTRAELARVEKRLGGKV